MQHLNFIIHSIKNMNEHVANSFSKCFGDSYKYTTPHKLIQIEKKDKRKIVKMVSIMEEKKVIQINALNLSNCTDNMKIIMHDYYCFRSFTFVISS